MWVAIGTDTKEIYMMSNKKFGLIRRLNTKYKSGQLKDGVYPEALEIQKKTDSPASKNQSHIK